MLRAEAQGDTEEADGGSAQDRGGGLEGGGAVERPWDGEDHQGQKHREVAGESLPHLFVTDDQPRPVR